MDQNEMHRIRGKSNSRTWIGAILLIAGVLLLAHKIGAPIPKWVFSWPVILILIGFLTGIKSGFRNAGAFILIIIGVVFLVDQIVPRLNFQHYILPALLIGVGLVYILRPKHNWDNNKLPWTETGCNAAETTKIFPGKEEYSGDIYKNATAAGGSDKDQEFVDINAIFGGVKKFILSKNFKGGEINTFMGGTELNLLQADIQQPVMLVANNVFGGTKLILPSNWDVKNELSAVFGGVEDKRSINLAKPDPGKILILKGSCVFGGIEITNY